jgi:hypothetical protein
MGTYHREKPPRHALPLRKPMRFLPSGWARDVLLEWSDEGLFTRVDAGQAPGGDAQRGR